MLRRKVETSSNASALSILFKLVMTTLKSNSKGNIHYIIERGKMLKGFLSKKFACNTEERTMGWP